MATNLAKSILAMRAGERGRRSHKANRFVGLEPMLLKDELKRVSAIQRI
jgi:hypothetical protein